MEGKEESWSRILRIRKRWSWQWWRRWI